MKAKVFVRPKEGVLDPQGKAIGEALGQLGFEGVRSVRAGRYFEVELSGGKDRERAREEVERMCRDLLANPIIEDFSFEIED